MVYHTFVAGEVLSAGNVMNDLMNQSVIVCTSGTRPSSPVTGMTLYETDTTNHKLWDGSAWQTIITRGRIASTNAVSTTSPVTTTETIYGGIANLSFTTLSGRRYKVTTKMQVESSVAADLIVLKIRDGLGSPPSISSTIIQQAGNYPATAVGQTITAGFAFDWTPAAGAHNLCITGIRNAGTGNVTLGHGTLVSYLIVEDIGV